MKHAVLRILIFLLILAFTNNSSLFAQDWKEEKGEHFIVRYSDGVVASWAKSVLRKAEQYYDKISYKLGITRHSDYWIWENRVMIIVYSDQTEFVQATGLPAWSRGGATRDANLFNRKEIVTYKQEDGFLEGVLPHEISHLILRDFMGSGRNIPMWFDEGIAQLHEKGKREQAQEIMRSRTAEGKYVPMNLLFLQDVRLESDPEKASLFYAQSVSVIDFMLRKFGSRDFSRLCREMKAGKGFEDAFHVAFVSKIKSIDELEKKWLSYLKNEF